MPEILEIQDSWEVCQSVDWINRSTLGIYSYTYYNVYECISFTHSCTQFLVLIMCAASHYVNGKLFKHDVWYNLNSCISDSPATSCEINYWQKYYTSLFVCLFACLLILATSCFNVKLLEYISCIPLLNYFHVCSGMQLKDKTTFMSFFVSYIYHMLGQQIILW